MMRDLSHLNHLIILGLVMITLVKVLKRLVSKVIARALVGLFSITLV
jgi:hypothetical protein